MNAIARNALSAYSQVDMEVNVSVASPCKLVLLLYDGAIKAISLAKFSMQDRKIAAKGEAISKAISIIDEGLKLSLDTKSGGEIAENLSALYDYMCHRLLMANIKNDAAALDEVSKLLADLREAWAAIEKSPEVMGSYAQPPDRPVTAKAATSFGRA